MSRTICLIIYNAPLFPAHWALWVPSPDIPTIGKRLHASGDAATGFQIVFERNYDISSETRRHQVLRLDQVSDYYVVDVKGYGNLIEDQTAHDDLERVVLSVPAPAQSLVAVTSQEPRKRVKIQNCQTWLREVVDALVRSGIMGEAALRIADSPPKN